MKALNDLRLFVCAAQVANLAQAARALDLSLPLAHAGIRRLETELGAALFVRSPRSLTLTQAGTAFLSSCEQALQVLTAGTEQLRAVRDVFSGSVRLSVPPDMGGDLVQAWLHEFGACHPAVQIELHINDDLAGSLHQPSDSQGLTRILIPENRRVLCAAPAYLARHGTPKHPRELARHNCLCSTSGERVHDHWRFTRGDEALVIPVRGLFQYGDGDTIRRMTRAGEGIAYRSMLDVAADLRSGALVTLCTDWCGESAPLHLQCSDRRLLRTVLRSLHDFFWSRVELAW
jgi:DNA-binding transcriptional LysR family regulator